MIKEKETVYYVAYRTFEGKRIPNGLKKAVVQAIANDWVTVVGQSSIDFDLPITGVYSLASEALSQAQSEFSFLEAVMMKGRQAVGEDYVKLVTEKRA